MPFLLLLSGCGPGFVFNPGTEMTRDEMPSRASHIFVGVIEKHHFDPWPFFRMPGVDSATAKYWMILRREVRVELWIKGAEPGKLVNVYEIFWVGGASGDWNATHDGQRALFLVRKENGRYHVIQDWWRSIFPVTWRHDRLPLDDSHAFWERIALMNWWIPPSPDARIGNRFLGHADPGGVLTLWRIAKLSRGLLRHPSREVRVHGCRELVSLRLGLDECWGQIPPEDWAEFKQGYSCCTAWDVANGRQNLERLGIAWWWSNHRDRDGRRLLTTVSISKRRREFCALYRREYPGDTDNGCSSDTPPATIVTEKGDVPLTSPRP
jgi:hypothetical protein